MAETTATAGLFEDGDVICACTRAQAMEDGVLVDVTGTAKEAGIRYPVALTAALWADIRDIPAEQIGVQDVAGRLWDCLWMFRCAARRVDGRRLFYRFLLSLPGRTQGARYREGYLVQAVIGPGDTPEPVITLMKPGED